MTSGTQLLERYQAVRRATEEICEPLVTEDYVIQSMPDASPAKWHLAHTTWFFESFLLQRFVPNYELVSEAYAYLFNSYYVTMGPRHCRPKRGLLSRPTVDEVYRYRKEVDHRVSDVLSLRVSGELAAIVELGLNHEQQHQELLFTDLKHLFSSSPLLPAYRSEPVEQETSAVNQAEPGRREVNASRQPLYHGVYRIGHEGEGFCYDNESPGHDVLLESSFLSRTLVTNRQYLAFIDADGYERPELWLSDGWYAASDGGWKAPLYWIQDGTNWRIFTLHGVKPLELDEPVCHVSFYEADAFARWAGGRLPREEEWEALAKGLPIEGNFVESGRLSPAPAGPGASLQQMFGDVWEWTLSPYSPYPHFTPLRGSLGEYNAKFMCNQYVLRGGSCVSPQDHLRASYRNFFAPNARWQFSGIRIAWDA